MKTESKYRQWAFIIRREFLAVSTRPAVLLVLMGGIFMYGLLYNYMYAPNKVTDMPVAVVDCSHSQLSRNYIRWLEATPQMQVYGLAGDFREAREWMKEARVQGIVYLPRDFEQRVYRGEEAVFPQYATTAAFLYFEALQGASSRVMLALSEECRPDILPFLSPAGNDCRGYGKACEGGRHGALQFHRGIRFVSDSCRDDGHPVSDTADGHRDAHRRRVFQRLHPAVCSFRLRVEGSRPGGAGQDVGVLLALCCLFALSAGAASAFLLHSSHRQRRGYRAHDSALPHVHLVPGAHSFTLLHRCGSTAAAHRFLFGGTDFSVGHLLSAGADALVLAGGPLSPTRGTRHPGFCQAELHGSQSGRYSPGIHRALGADAGLFPDQCMGVSAEAEEMHWHKLKKGDHAPFSYSHFTKRRMYQFFTVCVSRQ